MSARLAQDVNDARIALLIAEDRARRLRRETARAEAEVAEAEAALRDAQARLAEANQPGKRIFCGSCGSPRGWGFEVCPCRE